MRPAALVAVLALAACERDRRAADTPPPAPAAPATAEAPPAPSRTGPAGFVGRWGTDPARCAQAQYVLTRTALEAPDATFCSFRRVEETASGWSVEATCDGRDANIAIERIGDGLRLRVSGREPVTVRICPENWAAGLPPADPQALLDRAAAIDRRIAAKGAVRPYEFKHQGVIHQAWREADQVLKIAERTAQGETLWWFDPGAEEPFRVSVAGRDVLFERGRPLPPSRAEPDEAARLLARGRALRLAADG